MPDKVIRIRCVWGRAIAPHSVILGFGRARCASRHSVILWPDPLLSGLGFGVFASYYTPLCLLTETSSPLRRRGEKGAKSRNNKNLCSLTEQQWA
ncbi:hypothetical protein SAMN06265374_0620 [Roseibium denhamense]|uniref:Uncharacterized protein n=1 Tax=Roseibium denhamense TaxID=76305 RepID=A0ABY1NAA6_9HYPH|nr:hypothetical protein SAMN06265374_0620 [Roseibium denhamense]